MTSFGLWEFTCDRTATIDAYAGIARGRAETCACSGCRNFLMARAAVYPSDFIVLLDSLGIDSRKDGQVYHNGQLAPNSHIYGGWFHFIGILEKTGDFPVVPMGEGFSAWLCRKSAPELSGLRGLPLVQVEFHAECVPWVLSEPEAD